MHSSGQAAIDHVINNLNERTWAIIILDEVEPGRVEYTIRMNFTTVPSTNWISRWIAIGIDTRFQRYYLSGFLTLQHTIDDFLMQYERIGINSSETFLSPPSMAYTPMPTAAYSQNAFYQVLKLLDFY